MKIMFALLMLCIAGTVEAQITKEQLRQRSELRKLSRSELNAKASKAARKEAKRLTKEGWLVAPGALPLEKQLDRSYMMQQEFDDDNFPKYIMGEAMSIGENYDAAKVQALELAKLNLAGQIQTEVTAQIDHNVDNHQLAEEDAASVTAMVATAKGKIAQNIGRIISVVEAYRVLPNKNREVRVYIAYSATQAKAAAKAAIRQELEQQGAALREKLDKIMKW